MATCSGTATLGGATEASPGSEPGSGKKVGNGWSNFKHVFSGGDGVIYAVRDNGDLLWYRHDGWGDGSFAWAAGSGTKVDKGWSNFIEVLSG